uniref:SAWADEE domain-containing protein n=1 Tax=Steinernema glaseri TaxID=37863 RepID=A0A1I8A353_9BILA
MFSSEHPLATHPPLGPDPVALELRHRHRGESADVLDLRRRASDPWVIEALLHGGPMPLVPDEESRDEVLGLLGRVPEEALGEVVVHGGDVGEGFVARFSEEWRPSAQAKALSVKTFQCKKVSKKGSGQFTERHFTERTVRRTWCKIVK